MIKSIEELKEQLEVQFTGKFCIDYKITDSISLRSINRNTNYYLIIKSLLIANPIEEDKVLDIIKTMVLTELMELKSKYKADKDNLLVNGVTLG